MNRFSLPRTHLTWKVGGKGLRVLLLAVLPTLMMGTATGGREGTHPSFQLRIHLECIEVKRSSHHELVSRLGKKAGKVESPPSSLYREVLFLLNKGEAKRRHTSLSMARVALPSEPLQKVSMASAREVIYPTEYSPPELPGSFGPSIGSSVGGGLGLLGMLPQDIRPHMTAFETRYIGEVLEWQLINLARGENAQVSPEWLRLGIEFEINAHPRNTLWKPVHDRWGAIRMQMPEFEVQRLEVTVDLRHRKPILLSVSPAFDDRGQLDKTRLILVFVTPSLVPLDKPLSP